MPIGHRYACGCGVEHVVYPRDAGQILHCRCGATLEVPTLRRLRELPPADSGMPVHVRRRWSTWRGILFNTGLVTLIVALSAGAYLWRERSKLSLERPFFPYQEFVAKEVSQWRAEELWGFWSLNRDLVLSDRPMPDYLLARDRAQKLERWIAIAGGFAAAAVVASLSALLVGRRVEPAHGQ